MKEIKSKKSFLTLLITTCLILATTTFVPNIPAEGESCLDNLNAIFLSNAEEPMEVQATRLVNDELNTAAENWTLEELNTFLEDLEDDQGEDEDEELEFNPGYLSADQTFTAMVSYGFIPGDSEDLEAYRELYHDPYSLEGNVSLSRNFQVLKQYDFIPESLSLSDFNKLGRTGLTIRGFKDLIPIPPAPMANGYAKLTLDVSSGDQKLYANAFLDIPQTQWWPKDTPFEMSALIDVKVINDIPGWKYMGEYQTVVKDGLGHVIFDDEDEWHSFTVWKKSDGTSSGIIDVRDSDTASWDWSGASGSGVNVWIKCVINYELFHWENNEWVSQGPRHGEDFDSEFVSFPFLP